MRNRNGILCGVLALLLWGSLSTQRAEAGEVLLAQSQVLHKGESITAQVYGNKIKSGYAGELTLILRREDGKIITGYNPTIKGGYGVTLKPVQVKSKQGDTEQLLLGVKQGDWRAYSEYRLLDIADVKEIRELFTAADSFGVVETAYLEDERLKIKTVRDEESISVEMDAKLLANLADNRKKVTFGRLYSAAALDVDNDGIDELITNQQIVVDKRILADVGAVWRYKSTADAPADELTNAEQKVTADKGTSVKEALKSIFDKVLGTDGAETDEQSQATEESGQVEKSSGGKGAVWQKENLTIMKASFPDKRNTINEGAFFRGGMIYPVKMIAPNGEATYPQVMINEEVELENAWNKLLREEVKDHIKKYLDGTTDLAFNVLRADEKLISIQLISGKSSFAHHNINILPLSKDKARLSDVLNTKSKDLVELLNVLNTNEKVVWDKELTEEWYIIGDKLFLMKIVDDTEEVSSFELKHLHKYVKAKRFLEETKKDKPKTERTETDTENV